MTDTAILENDRPSIVESFQATTHKIIYIYSVPYEDRAGHLKVGDATLHTDKSLKDIEQKDIDKAANRRIREQNYTAKSQFKLEHAELAIRSLSDDESKLEGFRDHQVHTVLKNSGFSKGGDVGGEWFKVDLEVAKAAIEATKNHQLWLKDGEVIKSAIVLRPEQIKAIADTLKVFRAGSVENPKRMLWNAKMRFGKTLTAYGLVAKLEEAAKGGTSDPPKRILIMTHRPDVHDGWLGDFKKSELADNGWTFGSKRTDSSWDRVSKTDKFVWFASIQDLRGSFGQELSEEEFKKNQELFGSSWDVVISDEVHEGTLTQLAKRVYQELRASYFLDLSGTPFNVIQAESWEDEGLAERFSYHGQYNWSYPDERRAKEAWEKDHLGESNPYADCPEIRFITYDISAAIPSLVADENTSAGISFTELFSTEKDSKGKLKFKNEGQVRALLFKMLGSEEHSDDASLFPYSPSFRTQFRHTLWMLPNVDACGAMENLLNEVSSGFAGFTVVNATGRGAAGWTERNSLDEVKKAIKTSQNTITLSQGMLTTGVTVPEWTAVFMFNNTTSPMLYMQTAFRAASAGSLDDGRSKDVAYVFDFNPDRCLRQIVEIAKANAHVPAGTDAFHQEAAEKASVEDYLKYISVLALKGSVFKAPDSNAIMEQLNEAYINEIVSKGFDSPLLWNNRELNNFDIKKAQILEALRKIAGGKENDSRNSVKVSEITEEEKQRLLELRKQEKTQDPPPSEDDKKEKADLEAKEKAERKNRANAVSILVGIAARMPMLVFASPADKAITPQNFNELIDEESWKEFMPKNLRRLMPAGTPSLDERQDSALGNEGNILYWDDVRRFFDPKMFSMASERIRQLAREAFEKSPVERALRLYAIFATFKNPDKETVLTPARVVELQYSKTLGGLGLIDLENSTAKNVLIRTRRLVAENSAELNDPIESHPLQKAVKLLDEGTHELAPRWVTSDVDPVENDGKDFWENKALSVYDINSKTALYPLYAATSTWYANRPAYRAWREAEEQERLEKLRDEYLVKGITAKLQAKTFTDEELDADLWKEVVEKVIYLNVRVPYSARIARRVLTGFDENIRVNSTVVDVIHLKQAIAEWNSISKANRKTGWGKIKNEHKFIGAVLRLANTGFIQEHAPDLWKKLKQDENYRKIKGILGKINEGEMNVDDFKSLKDLVDNFSVDLPLFEACVGNPPYQKSSDTASNTATQIYPDFIKVAFEVSATSSLITPARWFNNEPQRDFRLWLVESGTAKKASSLLFYSSAEDVFTSDVFIRGGISILTLDHSHNGETVFKLENGSIKSMPLISESGTVDLDRTIVEIRELLKNRHFQKMPTKKMTIDYHNGILGDARKAWGSSSRATFVENSKIEASEDYNVRIRLTKNEWRYAKPSDITLGIPKGKFGVNFQQQVTGPDDDWKNAPGLNRMHILRENEALMSSIGITLDDIQKVGAFYRYSRTQFFTAIVWSRVGSHDASQRVYQDLPMFNFDDSDPINWKNDSKNIHDQLILHFGLDDYAEWFARFTTPYSAPLDPEYLSLLSLEDQRLAIDS